VPPAPIQPGGFTFQLAHGHVSFRGMLGLIQRIRTQVDRDDFALAEQARRFGTFGFKNASQVRELFGCHDPISPN
jgi:hypothetical protein